MRESVPEMRSNLRRIVFVNQSTGYLTIDVINKFAQLYDSVALLYGSISEESSQIDTRVKMVRIVTKTRRSIFGRLFRGSLASLQIQLLLWTKFRGYEVFYYSLPPFAYLGALFLCRRYSLMIFDVYPDVLRMIGIGDRNVVYRLWSWSNRRIFKRAYKIFTITDGLNQKLQKYSMGRMIYTIPLWSMFPVGGKINEGENLFIKRNDLEGKFVINYSGNIGQSVKIEIFIQLAETLKDISDIQLMIAGRGSKMDILKTMVIEKDVRNISVIDFQPTDMFKYSLACTSLGIVIVDDNFADVSIPSKIYNLLAAGVPILAITPIDSEVARMIRKFRIGKSFSRDQISLMKDFVKMVYIRPEKLMEMRENCILSSKYFTIANADKVLELYRS